MVSTMHFRVPFRLTSGLLRKIVTNRIIIAMSPQMETSIVEYFFAIQRRKDTKVIIEQRNY
jgi:hypothetical protein